MKHCEAKKGYETVIHGLKEQIAHKEAEVSTQTPNKGKVTV